MGKALDDKLFINDFLKKLEERMEKDLTDSSGYSRGAYSGEIEPSIRPYRTPLLTHSEAGC